MPGTLQLTLDGHETPTTPRALTDTDERILQWIEDFHYITPVEAGRILHSTLGCPAPHTTGHACCARAVPDGRALCTSLTDRGLVRRERHPCLSG